MKRFTFHIVKSGGSKVYHMLGELKSPDPATEHLRTKEMASLTADLVCRSRDFLNALGERELDLGGNGIATIEDQFDAIDLSYNEIVDLQNFPHLPLLNTLCIQDNRITRIDPNIADYLPKLHTLNLANNCIHHLAQIHPLSSLPKLEVLYLWNNNVTKMPLYREHVIANLKSLQHLDSMKVLDHERYRARSIFQSLHLVSSEKLLSDPEDPHSTSGLAPTQEQIQSFPPEKQPPLFIVPTQEQIKTAIENCQSLEECKLVEQAIKSRKFPADMKFSAPAVEQRGVLFTCDTSLKIEFFNHMVFGMQPSEIEVINKIEDGMDLFLLDTDLDVLYRGYKSVGPGRYNLVPEAFNGLCPCQVNVRCDMYYHPLTRELYKHVIESNGHNNVLDADQVSMLLHFFQDTIGYDEDENEEDQSERRSNDSEDEYYY